MTPQQKPLIGFIGQGWIGKNYAADFEARGFATVRYGLEPEYAANRGKIARSDIVFIAVPTPTTPRGADHSIIEGVLPLVGKGKIAVIKSTILPGTSELFQKNFPEIIVLHSPEFLTKSTAADDVAHPKSNAVGISADTAAHRDAAKRVLEILPPAPLSRIMKSRESELLKYATNGFYYSKTVYMNMLYDLAQSLDADWQPIREALGANPWIGNMHLEPVHQSGRGAGGPCLIKDFAAFRMLFESRISDPDSRAVLADIERKNLALLRSSGKDAAYVSGVYGPAAARGASGMPGLRWLLARLHDHTIVRYLFSGGTAAAINIGTLFVLSSVLHVWYLAASAISFLTAFVASFVLQKFWTFRDRSAGSMPAQGALYFLVALANLGLNTAIMYLLSGRLGLHPVLGQIIASGTLAFFSFFVYRHVIFKPVLIESKIL